MYSLALRKNGAIITCPKCNKYIIGKRNLSDKFFYCLGKCAEPYELDIPEQNYTEN